MPFIVGGIISGIGSIAGGILGSKGASKAADTQMAMFNRINQQEQPFIGAGTNALNTLGGLFGSGKGYVPGTNLPYGYLNETFNPSQAALNEYPGYQFALQTGGQAIRNADTPGVGALSGAALKDLTNFNVGTANQFYNQYFNQFQAQQQNIFSRLSNIANLGQSAASQTAQSGAQLGTGVAQAQAAGYGSLAGGLSGAANAAAGSIPLAYYMSQQQPPPPTQMYNLGSGTADENQMYALSGQ